MDATTATAIRSGAGHRRRQLGLVVGTTALLAASFVRAPFLEYQALQHIPTVIALGVLAVVACRQALSDGALLAIVGFLWLHILGARYIYSYVPYDEWASRLCGVSLSAALGLGRNHYDRVVHFGYGLLATVPQVEVLRRRWRLPRGTAHGLSLALVLAVGAAYEIFEWGLAQVMAPDWAEAYNGQQGDAWDAQQDMACNGLGALVASAVAWALGRRQLAAAAGQEC